MPSRDEMIKELAAFEARAAAGPSVPSRGGSIVTPDREQMIKELADFEASQNAPEEDGLPWHETALDKVTTGSRSVLEGMTLGISEPVIGGVNATIQTALGNGEGKNVLERLKNNYDSDVIERRAEKARNPMTDIGGQIGGAILPAVLTGGESLLVRAGRMAPTTGKAAAIGKALDVGGTVATAGTRAAGAVLGKVAGGAAKGMKAAGITRAAGPVLKGAGAVVKGAAEGGSAAVGSEIARQGVLRSTGYMKEGEGQSLEDVLETGSSWGAGLSALPQAYKAAKFLGKRGMSVALGPKVETIDKYLAARDRINAAPTVEAIKDQMDDIAIRLQEDVDQGLLSKTDAEGVLKAVQAEIRQTRTEAAQEFSRRAYDAGEAAKRAKKDLSTRVQGQTESLKMTRAPVDLASDVQNAIVQLKDDVVKGSQEALSILGNTKGTVNFQKAWKGLATVRDSMNIAGKGPATSQAAAAQKEIQDLIDRTGTLPTQMKLTDAKRLIQQLDRAERAIYNAGQFTDEVGLAFKQLRANLDQQLKEIPEYAAKMEEVAGKTRLLKRLQDRHGDATASRQVISGIHRPVAKDAYDDLVALGSVTGRGFVNDLDQFVGAQQTLSNPRKMRALETALPEFAESATAEARAREFAHPDAAREFADGAVKGAGLLDEQLRAEQAIAESRSKLAQAKNAQRPFRTLSPASTEAKINSMMRDSNPIETQRLMGRLDGVQSDASKMSLGNRNFSEAIEDRRILDSFEKGNTNGSRNVNLGTIVGHAVGGAALGVVTGGPVGALVGAIGGAVSDKYGPQIAKQILDAVATINGTPTVKKIQSLNLPPDMKNYISSQFIRHQSSVVRGARGRFAENDEDSKYDPSRTAAGTFDADEQYDREEAARRFIEGN